MKSEHGETETHTVSTSKGRNFSMDVKVPKERMSLSEPSLLTEGLQTTPSRQVLVNTPAGVIDLSEFAGIYHCETHTAYTLSTKTTDEFGPESFRVSLKGGRERGAQTKNPIQSTSLSKLLTHCDDNYLLITPLDDNTPEDIHPTSAFTSTVDEAASNVEFDRTPDDIISNIETSEGDITSCTINTKKGKVNMEDIKDILDVEGTPFYHITKPVQREDGIRIKTIPDSPGHAYVDTPEVFVNRLENGHFVPAKHDAHNTDGPITHIDLEDVTE